jgi:hypothetical protein
MSRRGAQAAVVLSIVALARWCPAQVEVTFPLHGFYRPGKFMPVRVESRAALPSSVVLRTDGAVTVSVEPAAAGVRGASVSALVPWLAGEAAGALRWEIAGHGSGAVDAPLTPLQADQVLVGVVGTEVGAAASAVADLFRGRQVIPIALTGTPPMPGHPAAWEALDAIVFDTPGNPALQEALSRGISCVVRSDASPGGDWPWRGGPGHWFVRFDAAGPRAAVDPDAYVPTQGWAPGWPAPLRRRAILLALAFSIVVLAASLWRSRRGAAALVVALSAIAALLFLWWGRANANDPQAVGDVIVTDGHMTQVDRWLYVRSLRETTREVGLGGQRPVFFSARHMQDAGVVLHCSADGSRSNLEWHARPGATMAFVERRFVAPATRPAPGQADAPPSPLRTLAREAYLDASASVEGDVPAGAPADLSDWVEVWPSVVVSRPAP